MKQRAKPSRGKPSGPRPAQERRPPHRSLLRTPTGSTGAAARRAAPANDARGIDTCQIAGHFPIALRGRLKHLEAATGRSLQDLLGEAIADVLAKYAKAKRSRR